jgi:hypothetical protein
VGSTVSVTFGATTDMRPGVILTITDGTNLGIYYVSSVTSGTVAVVGNQGGTGTLGSGSTMGAGHVYFGAGTQIDNTSYHFLNGQNAWVIPSKTICWWEVALRNDPPTTNYATFTTRNAISLSAFNDTTDYNEILKGIIPDGCPLTASGLTVKLHWIAATATTGKVKWGVQFERMNTDLDADSFDTEANNGTGDTTSGTSGIVTVSTITTANIDGLTAQDGFRLRIWRRPSDTTNDTMSGDAQLVLVHLLTAAA